jgi:drug/metabolite transporter (DMT)-like permease
MKKHLPLIATLCLVFSLLFQTAGIVCNKAAAAAPGAFTAHHVFVSPLFWLTLVCMGCQAITWQIALRRFQLSTAYLVLSLSYVLLLVFSATIFHETITLGNQCGAALIIVGVIFLTRGEKQGIADA